MLWPGLPRSLHARMLAIVLLSIVALQLLSLLSVGAWRGWQARELANGLIVDDLLHQRARLLALPPAQRAPALRDQDRGAYAWTLVAGDQPLPPADDAELQALVRAVARRGLQQTTPVHWPQAHGALRTPLADGQDLLLHLAQPLPSTRPTAGAVAGYVAVLGALVGLVAWWAVSQLTAPLRRMTDAAQALTANLDRPPLSEQGPLEVRTLAQAFNSLQREVQRQLRAHTGILAAVTHDLKSPLTRMKLRAAALDMPELRRRLEHDLDAMDALVEEGLAYARSERLHEPLAPVDLGALIEMLVEQANDLGQDCRMPQSGRLAPVVAAPRALQRLLQNLVDNALRYGGGAELTVSDSQVGGRDGVQVLVSDRGPGLPDADLERMFEPFVRGDASRGPGGGTGLGLAIARNIAQAHGGQLSLERRAGGGLVARLWLPRRAEA